MTMHMLCLQQEMNNMHAPSQHRPSLLHGPPVLCCCDPVRLVGLGRVDSHEKDMRQDTVKVG